jgi:hypothetical protein
MRLSEWLAAFRILHKKAHENALDEAQRALYLAHRDELARAMMAAQRLALPPGRPPRQELRVARALQLDLTLAKEPMRLTTLDVGSGGFATLVDRNMNVGDVIDFSLRLPGQSPATGKARVVDLKAQNGRIRGCFAFTQVPDPDRERIEMFVFDATLDVLSA